MAESVTQAEHVPPAALERQLTELEETYRATLNILDDFDRERERLRQFQQATLNILEDIDEERRRFAEIQRATMNLLEDMNEERRTLDTTQRALMNILDDVEAERARAEQARNQLAAANKELEAFSYSVSHDLRAPLRAISGFADAVLEDYSDRLDADGRRYLGLISENVGKMGRLIDDLLRFSRLLRQPLAKSAVDVRSLAQEVYDELASELKDRDVSFVSRDVPLAHADRALLRQLLANLISNALKFTRTREKAVIEFGFLSEADGGAYYMRDNGVGFDMRYVDKLFGVFQRLHEETQFEGTGVGLAIVQRVVARHGGRVWAEGKEGEGAVFYFTLPAEEENR